MLKHGKGLFFTLVLLALTLQAGCQRAYPHVARAGFGMSTRSDPRAWAERLGAGWFLDWGTRDWSGAEPLEYWQTIRLSPQGIHPDLDQIARLARRNRGSVWVIANEPDNALQDNIPPELFAAYYHAIYARIKKADRTAQVAVGGVSQPSALRMEYLEQALRTYQDLYGTALPCDWWTIHAYVLREQMDSWGAGIPVGLAASEGLLIEPDQHGDVALFQQQISDFRVWMKENGYRDTPLAVTEFGILLPEDFGYSADAIAAYLEASVTWLDSAQDAETGYPGDENRLVQRWAWFSLSDPIFPVADLADLETGQLTAIGEAYRRTLAGQAQP